MIIAMYIIVPTVLIIVYQMVLFWFKELRKSRIDFKDLHRRTAERLHLETGLSKHDLETILNYELEEYLKQQ